MQASNQKGLIWGRWRAQECGRAVETTAALMGLAEFHTGELRGAGTSGLRFCCVWSERGDAAHTLTQL